MSRHDRLRHTLRSPVRARRLRLRAKRKERLAMLLEDAGLPAGVELQVRERLMTVRKRASLMPGGQLRGIFGREGRPDQGRYARRAN